MIKTVSISYDTELDHFFVEGTETYMQRQYHVTGFKAAEIFSHYEREMMNEVEIMKRNQRKE